MSRSIALMLGASGVGSVLVSDPQNVSPDNLNSPLLRPAHIGLPKVETFAELLGDGVNLKTAACRSDSKGARSHVAKSSLVISASNTRDGRLGSMRSAFKYRKPFIGVSVLDGRTRHAGIIVTWLPDRPELACQACFLGRDYTVRKGEGLLYTVVAATAGLAANMALQLLTGVKDDFVKTHNLVTINLETYTIEAFRVMKRPDCMVCGHLNGRKSG